MKYELDQTIFYLQENKVKSAKVLSRTAIENLKEYEKLGTEQMTAYAPWGKEGVWYNTCHGIFEERHVFPSKEALLESL